MLRIRFNHVTKNNWTAYVDRVVKSFITQDNNITVQYLNGRSERFLTVTSTIVCEPVADKD